MSTLTPAEIAAVTGKRRIASQVSALARMGVPFTFRGRTIEVERTVAQAFALLRAPVIAGVDMSRVR